MAVQVNESGILIFGGEDNDKKPLCTTLYYNITLEDSIDNKDNASLGFPVIGGPVISEP